MKKINYFTVFENETDCIGVISDEKSLLLSLYKCLSINYDSDWLLQDETAFFKGVEKLKDMANSDNGFNFFVASQEEDNYIKEIRIELSELFTI